MIADDLVQLDEPTVLDEPGREALVEIGARLLRQRVVGGVADEEMAEAKRVVVHEPRRIGTDHVLADQRLQVRRHVVACRRGRELFDDASMKDLAFHGPAADDVALVGPQPVEASLEERVNGGRDDEVSAVLLGGHGEHLLQEQRVPIGGRKNAPANVGIDFFACELVDEPLAVVGRQRLEREGRGVQLPAAPVGTELMQLGACDAEEKDGGIARPLRHVLDQVQKEVFRPLDVVEEHELRPLGGTPLQELAEGELRLGGRRPDHRLRLDADRNQDLDQRPVRDVLPVVEAPRS